MCTSPQPEPRDSETLGPQALWARREGSDSCFHFGVPAARTVREAGKRRRLKGMPDQAILHLVSDTPLDRHLAPMTIALLYPLWLDPFPPPKKLGSMSLLDRHELLWCVQGVHPPAFYSISSPGVKFQPQTCVTGKHILHQ